jgi:hypothetical protein
VVPLQCCPWKTGNLLESVTEPPSLSSFSTKTSFTPSSSKSLWHQ